MNTALSAIRKITSQRRNWLIVGAVLVGILAISTLAIFGAYRIHTFTSDDVAQQTIVGLSGTYGLQQAWIGVDNFVVKLPFYQMIHALFGQSRTALLIIVITFNTVLFAGILGALWLVWREHIKTLGKKITWPVVWMLLALLWVCSIGGDLANSTINPNVRNAEIGVSIFLAVLALQQSLKTRAKWWSAALIGVAIGASMYNDPYFLYTLFAPLAVVPIFNFFLYKTAQKINAWYLYGTLAVALVVNKVADHFTAAIGFNVYHPDISLANSATIGKNIINAINSYLSIFHGNFFNQPIGLGVFVLIVNAFLATTFIVLAVRSLRAKAVSPYAVLFGLTIMATVVLYTITTNSDSASTVRYLVLLPYSILFLIPFALGELRNVRIKWALVTLFVVASIGNVVSIGQAIRHTNIASDLLSNTQNLHVVDVLESQKLTKGYADYWDGNIHTYLSGGKTLTIPLTCNDKNQLQVYYWLMDAAWLQKPAHVTYIITDKTYPTFTKCGAEAREKQFGQPERLVQLDDARTLYIYNYDIYSRMPKRATTDLP